MPALVGAFGLSVLMLAAVCWVLANDARCERAAKVLEAWRGAPTPVTRTRPPAPARPRLWRRAQ
jgi:hypothetical protein